MTTSLNTIHADATGRLDLYDEHMIPALAHDPVLTINGALFPTVTLRPGHHDGIGVELYDPLTDTRMTTWLDAGGARHLAGLLADLTE